MGRMTAKNVMGTLNGTDPSSNETGKVQRIMGKNGNSSWDAVERLEPANR